MRRFTSRGPSYTSIPLHASDVTSYSFFRRGPYTARSLSAARSAGSKPSMVLRRSSTSPTGRAPRASRRRWVTRLWSRAVSTPLRYRRCEPDARTRCPSYSLPFVPLRRQPRSRPRPRTRSRPPPPRRARPVSGPLRLWSPPLGPVFPPIGPRRETVRSIFVFEAHWVTGTGGPLGVRCGEWR